MKVSHPKHIYPPVNRCIYCDSAEGKLSSEHIVPFGLLGRHELPEASCRDCAEKTGRIENIVLKDYMGGFRSRMQFPNRRGRKRNYPLKCYEFIGSDNSFRAVEISPDEYPKTLFLPKLSRPGMFLTPEQNRRIASAPLEWWIHHDDHGAKILREKLGFIPLFVIEPDVSALAHMIGKVCHSYACAVIGYERLREYKMYYPPALLDMPREHIYFIVGGSTPIRQNNTSYEINIIESVMGNLQLVIATVRFLAWLGAPAYRTIVASRPAPPNAPRSPIQRGSLSTPAPEDRNPFPSR